MFVIRKSQFDAFIIPFRKKARDKMLADLQQKELGKVYEEETNIIIEDSKGNRTTIFFSEEYLAEKIIKPSGLAYRFRYNEDDKLVSILFPGEEKIHFLYEDDLLKGIRLNKDLYKINYDAENRISTIHYPDNKAISFTYNQYDELIEITNRQQEKRSFDVYLRDNQLIYKNTDALGRITEFETDCFKNIVKVVFPDGTVQQTQYDEELDAERTLLKNGSEKISYYDERFVSNIAFEDGGYIHIEGDEDGIVDALENENGTIFYQYDAQIAEAFQQKKITYIYDEDDLLTALTYPSGLVVTYQYDEDGRLKGITTGNQTCYVQYATNDIIAAIYYPNGIIEHRKHKILTGLEEVTLKTKRGETISLQQFEYDELSRMVKYRNQDSFCKPSELHISYDAESRITECRDIISGKKETYRYDGKGNMIDNNGRRVKIGIMDQPLSIGGIPIEYDKGGNITSFYNEKGELIQLQFNDAGVLKYATIGKEEWEYWYDALGRRIGKSNGKKTFTYYWAGDNLMSEEYKGNGITSLREYIYTPYNSLPIGSIENGKTYWLHKDARGAVCRVTDENGTVVWNASYDAFGNATLLVNTIRQPWRLMGQYLDEETGLHYNYARYYSPILKTYLSLNPQWYIIDASNYSYALNNPFNRVSTKGNVSVGLSIYSTMVASLIDFCISGPTGAAIGGFISNGIASATEKKEGLFLIENLEDPNTSMLTEVGLLSGKLTPVVAGEIVTGAISCLIDNTLENE